MVDSSHPRSGATDLDLALLAPATRIQTNWHVITGGACCGKTTLIDMLAGQGFQTLAETARQLMDGEMARGRTVEEIFENGAAFETLIMDAQREAERGLRATDVVFLDRALPDCLTFFRIFGLDPNEILAECLCFRYASVFVLDLLPLELDGARIEDETFTIHLDAALACDYRALGYDVVRVPVLPPGERLEFVRNRLTAQGLL